MSTQLEMADAFALRRTPITAGSVLAEAGVTLRGRGGARVRKASSAQQSSRCSGRS